jgi:hypothetical protein
MEAVTGQQQEIIGEIYRALVLLGADSELLGTVGSWKDSLPGNLVLSGLKTWNQGNLEKIKVCIEHYEISAPRSACIHTEVQQTSE